MPLAVYVYRQANSRTDGPASVTVVNVEGPFEPTDDAPPFLLDTRNPTPASIREYARLVPAEMDAELGTWRAKRVPGAAGPMFGGSYAGATDGRFRKALGFYGAVAIHDRYETVRDAQEGTDDATS